MEKTDANTNAILSSVATPPLQPLKDNVAERYQPDYSKGRSLIEPIEQFFAFGQTTRDDGHRPC